MLDAVGPKKRAYEWTEAKVKAVDLLVDGHLTHQQVAERVGVCDMTLSRWRGHPEFRAKLQKANEDMQRAVFARGIARRVYRVREANFRHQELRRVIAARAADPEMAHVPGGDTGLLVRTKKIDVKEGAPGGEVITLYAYEVDVGLLAEMRQIEKQVAIEVGEWTEKREHGGSVHVTHSEGPMYLDLTKLTDEQLEQLGAIIDAARQGGGQPDPGEESAEPGLLPAPGVPGL